MTNWMRKLALASAVAGTALFAGCRDNDGRAEDRQMQSETEPSRIESNDAPREGSHDLSGGPAEEGTGGSGQGDEALGGELPEQSPPEGSETHRELTGEDNSESQQP